MTTLRIWVMLAVAWFGTTEAMGQDLVLTRPTSGSTFPKGEPLAFEATFRQISLTQPNQLRVYCYESGWRKLKMGNNPINLYSPKVDVTQGGNTHIELIIKRNSPQIDWSKIQFRPGGITANPVALAKYIPTGINEQDWFILTIPMSAFDPTAPFNALNLIEFPYSAGAGLFDLSIASIRFTGGTTPYVWLGPGKGFNIHDGKGGTGQVNGVWIAGSNPGPYVPEVRIASGNEVLARITGLPAITTWTPQTTGTRWISAQLFLGEELLATTSPIELTIMTSANKPPVIIRGEESQISTFPVGQHSVITYHVSDPEGTQIRSAIEINQTGLSILTTPEIKVPVYSATESLNIIRITATDSDGMVSTVEDTIRFKSFIDNPQAGTVLHPTSGESFVTGTTVGISAAISTPNQQPYSYLLVSSPGTGYRKLKIGNSSAGLYSPLVDVVGQGNDTLVLVMKDFNHVADWSKIVVAPQENLTNPVNLRTYWNTAIEIGDGWKRMSIPLNRFSSTINFHSISYLAIPYSQSAGNFILGIREISFTGSPQPFLWFGGNKTNNYHDGFGGAGQLSAVLKQWEPDAATMPILLISLNDTVLLWNKESELTTEIANIQEGQYNLEAFRINPDNTVERISEVSFTGISPAPPANSITIDILFEGDPGPVDFHRATLKYNKDFAISFTFDDAYADAYSNAYTLLNGGIIGGNGESSPGLFYTDGCGNSVPFTAAVAWYSVNSTYSDIHTVTPGYITWQQIREMYDQGWDLLNHSYSHRYGPGTDYAFEISENKRVIEEKTGIQVQHFVVPTGDLNYVPVAFQEGNRSVLAFKSNFTGYPSGIDVSQPINLDNISIYRRFLYDGLFTAQNIDSLADLHAARGAAGQHFWLNEFTHRIHFSTISGSLHFNTFSAYMKELANRYGKSGTDKIWVASTQEVYEYLMLRDLPIVVQNREGNTLRLTLDISALPVGLRRYHWSFIGQSGVRFSLRTDDPRVSAEGATGPDGTALVNVRFNPASGTKSRAVNAGAVQKENQPIPENAELKLYPNPVADHVTVYLPAGPNAGGIWKIRDLKGKEVASGRYSNSLKNQEGNYFKINLNLPTGSYFIEYTEGVKKWSAKLLVQ